MFRPSSSKDAALPLMDYETYRKQFREPGWRHVWLPLLVPFAVAVILSGWLMDTPWAERAPEQVAGVAVLLGAGTVFLTLLWLRLASPLVLPKVFGIWGPVAELADRLGLHFGGIDLRRNHVLSNRTSDQHLDRIEREYEGPFERDRKTRLAPPRPGEPPLKSDLVRKMFTDGGVQVAHRAWRRPPVGWVHVHTAVAPFAPRVAMVLGYNTSEAEQYRERLSRLQRQLAFGEMLSGFIHDSKNLHFAARSALRALETEDDPTARLKLLRLLENTLDAADEMVERAGSFANRRVGARVCTHVGDALRNVSALLAMALPKGITLAVELSEAPQWVELDPVEFDHTLLNLVINARDALGVAGHITVRCGPGPKPGTVQVAVQDDGPGVAEPLREHIFDPFVTTKSDADGEGHGLGLAMAKAFAESAGGTLVLEDTVKGACFTFTFPTCTPCEGPA